MGLDRDIRAVEENPEAKLNPIARESGGATVGISDNNLKKFIEKLETDTAGDISIVSNHQQSLSHWYARRFQTLDKDPQYPWPGSSNITMPLIDMEVTKAKAPLMNMFEVDPIVTFKARNVSSYDKTEAAESTFQWLLNDRMRDFKENMEICIDNMKQGGYGLIKTVYEYKTSFVTETVRKSELDQDFLATIANLRAVVEAGQPIETPDGPIVPTIEDFQIEFSNMVSERWGLDVEDEVDQKAAEKIMDFIIKEQDDVEIQRTFITHDAPFSHSIDPSRFFIEEGAMSIEDSERLTEVFTDTVNDMQKKAQTGWYDKDAVVKIVRKIAAQEGEQTDDNTSSQPGGVAFSQLQNERREREGLTATARMGVIWMKEVYCLYDFDNTGVKEKALLIYNPDTNIAVRFMKFPYEHGEWPYIQYRNEETDGRYFSPRGIGEIINGIDDMITQNHRSKLNSMSIANSPTFKYRIGSNINPANIRYIPGQFIPVMGMADFEQVPVQAKDLSFDNEEAVLRFWSEGVLGSTDFVFREQQKSEARTAQEVSAIQGIAQSAQSLQISRFQRTNKKLYHQIWSLWMQYGPARFTLSTSDGQLNQMNKFQVEGRFDIVPTGTVGNANPQVEFIRAQQRLSSILGVVQAGALGAISQEYDVDIGAAFKDMFDKDDFMASNKIVRRRSEEEIAQIQQQQQEAAQAQAEQARQDQAVKDNQEVSPAELQGTLKRMESQSPNGGDQKVAV